jgi:hypothetical protein
MMADVIDLTSETPSELTENMPLLENSENSENSDESQPKKRPRGRPKSNGKGKYTINPDQKRGMKLGRIYVEPKSKTPEQLERSKMMRRKNGTDHYFRLKTTLRETQKKLNDRNEKIAKILENAFDLIRLNLENQTDDELNRLELNPQNILSLNII